MKGGIDFNPYLDLGYEKKMKVWEREMSASYPTNPFPKKGGL
jgi:hypothetical protein